MYRELYHFNKNHDPKTGQFTTAVGSPRSTSYVDADYYEITDVKGRRSSPLSGETLVTGSEKAMKSAKSGISSAKSLEEHTRKRGTYDLSNMSDEDLRKEINRMNMEQQYANLKDAEISAGRRNVHDSLQVAEDIAGLGVSAAVIASLIYKARTAV